MTTLAPGNLWVSWHEEDVCFHVSFGMGRTYRIETDNHLCLLIREYSTFPNSVEKMLREGIPWRPPTAESEAAAVKEKIMGRPILYSKASHTDINLEDIISNLSLDDAKEGT